MSRFLFAVPPLAGHVNPTIAVARALAERGHDVAWTGRAETVRRMLGPDASVFDAGDPSLDALWQARQDWLRLRHAAALKFLWEEFIVPLARASLPGVEAAVDAFRPDVLVVDQQAMAGALVARRRGLPWATSATTAGELTQPYAAVPKVAAWVTDCMATLQREAGLTELTDLRFSDHLVLAYTSPALLGRADFPDHYVFVGPAIADRPGGEDFPWQDLAAGRRRVLVSLGTVNADAGARFFAAVIGAAEQLSDRVQMIAAVPPETVPGAPAGMIVRAFVPQLALLPHLDAVVCHAGQNTVSEALAHGLPLVVAPIRDDQPIIASQVVAAGAGVRVRFARAGADDLRDAVTAVLDDPAYRSAAAAVQASFTAAGGASTAADHLEKLA